MAGSPASAELYDAELAHAKRQFFSLHRERAAGAPAAAAGAPAAAAPAANAAAERVEVIFTVFDRVVGRDWTKSAGLVPVPTCQELVDLFRLLFDDHLTVSLEVEGVPITMDSEAQLEGIWAAAAAAAAAEGHHVGSVRVRVRGSRFDTEQLPTVAWLSERLSRHGVPLHRWTGEGLTRTVEELCMRVYKGEAELRFERGRAVVAVHKVRLRLWWPDRSRVLVGEPLESLERRYGRNEDVTEVALRVMRETFVGVDTSAALNADFEPLGFANPDVALSESREFPGALQEEVTQTFEAVLPQLPDTPFDTPLHEHRFTAKTRGSWRWVDPGSPPAPAPRANTATTTITTHTVPTVVRRLESAHAPLATPAEHSVPPPAVEDITEERLGTWLRLYGVNTDLFGVGGAKTLKQLVREVRIGECSLTLERREDGVSQPLRVVKVAKLMIRHPRRPDLLLVETHQLQNGSMRVPFQTVSEKFLPHEHTWDAVLRGLEEELLDPIRRGYVAMAADVQAEWEAQLQQLKADGLPPVLPPRGGRRRPSLAEVSAEAETKESESASASPSPVPMPRRGRAARTLCAPTGESRRIRGAEPFVADAVDATPMRDAPRRLIRMLKPQVEFNISPSYPGLRSQYCLHSCEIEVQGLPAGDFRTMEGRTVHFFSWLNPVSIRRMNTSLLARVDFYIQVQGKVDTGGDKGEKEALERYMVEAVQLNDVRALEVILDSWIKLNRKMAKRRLMQSSTSASSAALGGGGTLAPPPSQDPLLAGSALSKNVKGSDPWQAQLDAAAARAAMSSMSTMSPLTTTDSHGNSVLRIAALQGPRCREVGALLIRMHLAESHAFGTRVPNWDRPRPDLNIPRDDKATLLDCAARLDHAELIRQLLMAGALPDTVCFHCLCEQGCIESMRLLLPLLRGLPVDAPASATRPPSAAGSTSTNNPSDGPADSERPEPLSWCGHAAVRRESDEFLHSLLLHVLRHSVEPRHEYIGVVLQQCSPAQGAFAEFLPSYLALVMAACGSDAEATATLRRFVEGARFPLHTALCCARALRTMVPGSRDRLKPAAQCAPLCAVVSGVLRHAASEAEVEALLAEDVRGVVLAAGGAPATADSTVAALAIGDGFRDVVATDEFQGWLARRWGPSWQRCLLHLPPALLLLLPSSRDRSPQLRVLAGCAADSVLLLALWQLDAGVQWQLWALLAWCVGERRRLASALALAAAVLGALADDEAAEGVVGALALVTGAHALQRFALTASVGPALWTAWRALPALAAPALVLGVAMVALATALRAGDGGALQLFFADYAPEAEPETVVLFAAALAVGPLFAVLLVATAVAEWGRQREAGRVDCCFARAQLTVRGGRDGVALPPLRLLAAAFGAVRWLVQRPDIAKAAVQPAEAVVDQRELALTRHAVVTSYFSVGASAAARAKSRENAGRTVHRWGAADQEQSLLWGQVEASSLD